MSDSFVHLHVHTEYSLLDGAAKVNKLAKRAAEYGMPALACSDHGNMFGVLNFYKACQSEGVKPIIGIEAYQARHSVDERPKARRKNQDVDFGGEDAKGSKLYHHLTLLAENNTGYQNLMKLSSQSYLEGFYHKPRMDWDSLAAHSEGLIATSGCLGGIVLQELLHEDFSEAMAAAGKYKEILGPDNFFMEIQDHGIPEQTRTNPQLMEIAKKIGVPLVATNDSHYVDHADCQAHDALLCVQTRATLADPDRFKFHGDDFYLKQAHEMRHLFRDIEEACDNTLVIAERCNVEIDFDRNLLPKFDVPEGHTEMSYLRELVGTGMTERWPDLTDEIKARIEFELEVIEQMGFPGYFLIVWDLVRHAKATGIRVGPARGSAGGSAVAYALRITEIDPMEWGLIFERFLNPSRISMPDIDLDFDTRYKEHMLNYCIEKYGSNQVAQIVTFAEIKSRNAIRDAAKILGHPYKVGSDITKVLPPQLYGRDVPLDTAIQEHEPLRELYNLDPDSKEIIDIARGLEGLRRSAGIHAGAVVIAPGEMTDYCPVWKQPDSGIATQYDMHGVEDLGLLKVDILGLRNLDIITDCVELVKERHGVDVDLKGLDITDVPTYELLSESKTVGVFQLEGTQMRALLRRLKPTNFSELAAALALYRPGPMAQNMHNDYADRKNGRQPIEYFHPDAEELLADTYGLMIYQEQLMAVAQKFAGYTLAEADNLRKACGKKLPEVMEKERGKFESAVVVNGYESDLAVDLFDMIAGFADYAFNASHAFGYAMISFQTAYLKCHYPAEYFTALLTSVQSDHDRLSVYLTEASRQGFELRSPDINLSQRTFYPIDDHTIIFGFLAIKNVGEVPAQAIIAERERNGPFESFFDFANRCETKATNKKAVESLIKTGTFDSLGHPRLGLVKIAEEVLQQAHKDRKQQEYGMDRLFEIETDRAVLGVPELTYPSDQLLALEKEYLGVFVSGHPLGEHQDQIEELVDHAIEEVIAMSQDEWGGDITVAGIITKVRQFTTKKGDPMKSFDLQDLTGQIPIIVFPKQTQKFGHMVREDDIVVVQGKPDHDREGVKLILNGITRLQRAYSMNEHVHIWVPDEYSLDEIKTKINESSGNGPVIIHYRNETVLLPEEYKASIDTIKQKLGEIHV